MLTVTPRDHEIRAESGTQNHVTSEINHRERQLRADWGEPLRCRERGGFIIRPTNVSYNPDIASTLRVVISAMTPLEDFFMDVFKGLARI